MSFKLISIVSLFFLILFFSQKPTYFKSIEKENRHMSYTYSESTYSVRITNDVLIENYFEYIDSIIKKYDSLTPYTLSEHLIIRANSWVIDTLKHTDYYYMKARDSFIYNQKKMIALPKGSSLIIPDYTTSQKLLKSFQDTWLDINIPEFKLRIFEGSSKLYEFPIRVGRNEIKFLEMSGREEDLRTKTGKGHIINYNRYPRFFNPVNNHEYFVTKRDDEKVTLMPQIPFIEAEINGMRYGQLIHPTTNPKTLGKAYSNGCIGTSESDAWVIYYYSPIGTRINIRYNLKIIDSKGDTLVLKDIYNKQFF